MPLAFVVILLGTLLAGCAQTTRVDDALITTAAGQQKTGLVLLKIGTDDDPVCAANIGVKENDLYRTVKTVRVIQKRNEPGIAEFELPPGEYHITALFCHTATDQRVFMADQPFGGLTGMANKSFASFSISAGEVVNIGAIRPILVRFQNKILYEDIETDFAVSDWTLADIEKFRQKRPNLYARMRTRLMAVIGKPVPTAREAEATCAEFRKLKSEGKLQNVPGDCR